MDTLETADSSPVADPASTETLVDDRWNRAEPPLKLLVRLLNGPWSVAILTCLQTRETARFTELRTALNGAPAKSLSARLQFFAEEGLVNRVDYGGMPPRVEYSITERGRDLLPLLRAMADWAVVNLNDQSTSVPVP